MQLEIHRSFNGLDIIFSLYGFRLLIPWMLFLTAVFQLVPALVTILLMSKHVFSKNQASEIGLLVISEEFEVYLRPNHRYFHG